jgi:hypothetical protein
MPLLHISDELTDKLEGLFDHCRNASAAPSIGVLHGLLQETSRGHVPPEDDEADGGDAPLDFHNTFGDDCDDEYDDDDDFGDAGMYLCIYVSILLCAYVFIYVFIYLSMQLCIYVSLFLCLRYNMI